MILKNLLHETEIDLLPTEIGVTIHDEPYAEFTETQIKLASTTLCGVADCECCKFSSRCYDADGKDYLIMVCK